MKPVTIVFVLSGLNIVSAFSQAREITCSSVNNPDNSVSIYADSRVYGAYTLKVTFTSLMGYSSNSSLISNTAFVTVEYGKREIIKLTPVKSSITYSFQYRYQCFPGVAMRKSPDSSFAYLLPAKADNHLRISEVSSLSERLGRKKTDDYCGTGFIYKLNDTICASRAGIIYDCNDEVKEGENAAIIYKSVRNRIMIEHKDGSLGNYEALAPLYLLVSPGDHVYPGQPLAVFNKESERYTVLFSTFYLDQKKLIADKSDGYTSSPSCFSYMPAHFYSSKNEGSILLQVNKEYTVQHPADIIIAEMSKKEKKKLGYQ